MTLKTIIIDLIRIEAQREELRRIKPFGLNKYQKEREQQLNQEQEKFEYIMIQLGLEPENYLDYMCVNVGPEAGK